MTIKNEGFEDSIKLKAAIDRSKLGKRFRKELGKIESEILALSREQLLQFEQDGTMMIQGNEIVRDEITVCKSKRKKERRMKETKYLFFLDFK